MHKSNLHPLLGIIAGLLFVSSMAHAQTTPTVKVNCNHGQSINNALKHHPNESSLIVEITGMCQENVVVMRDRVTLRGTDPAKDGIQAVANTETIDAALWVRGAELVTVENLKLAGGYSGLIVEGASLPFMKVINCRVENNGNFGVVLESSSLVQVEDTIITANRFNAAAFEGSNLRCNRCTISDPGGVSPSPNNLLVVGGSSLLLTQSTLANGGIQATGAFLLVSYTAINASAGGVGISANGQSYGTLTRLQISGPIRFLQGTNLTLQGVTQTASGTGNSLDDNAYLRIGDAPPAAGGPPSIPSVILSLNVRSFSNAVLTQTSQINGNLSCNMGANAFCANPANVSGTSTCALCPKP